ncbi:MAG: esterase, partial [Rubrivivax sp.]|nr:esterase [Rubrivivax sp.]
MELPIEWLPAAGAPEQLILLFHGDAGSGADMAPLAQALRAAFPQAALLAPDAAPSVGGSRHWAAAGPPDDDGLAPRLAAALPGLLAWVQAQQQRLQVSPAAT